MTAITTSKTAAQASERVRDNTCLCCCKPRSGYYIAGLLQCNCGAPCTPQFKQGDKGYCLTGQHAFWSTYGTYAQFVCTHESTLAPIPAGLSYQEAAAVPLAAMTAWQALEPSMPLQGKRVLVHAGAGVWGTLQSRLPRRRVRLWPPPAAAATLTL